MVLAIEKTMPSASPRVILWIIPHLFKAMGE